MSLRAGLTETRCVLRRPWLVLVYLMAAMAAGIAGLALRLR